ncbi:MAG: VWA domain-containing protein [Vicingaceae bacterium]
MKNFKHLKLLFLFVFFGVLNFEQSLAQENTTTRILFVFDGSQSMYGRWENETKLNIATRLLDELVDSLKGYNNVQLALRIYGHQDPVAQGSRNCKDTKLEVPFGRDNHSKIKDKLSSIRPKGTTLIAYSLEKSANDFTPCEDCKNIIILITDGIEECDGDPCLVSMNLQKRGVVLKPFVIGMGLDKSVIEQFNCVGNFYDVRNKEEFRDVLGVVISQAMNTTSVQVNLLDKNGNPTETDVGMTFYDQVTGQEQYHFMHALNHRGLPDTLPIDPLGKYRLLVHTIPPVVKDEIKLQPGIHNIIAVDAPQGSLLLSTIGSNEYKELKAIVRKSGSLSTLNVQSFDQDEKYLVGTYELEVLTLPRVLIKDVQVLQSHGTTVEIPGPGILTAYFTSSGITELYVLKDGKKELIYRFNQSTTRQNLVLQPGSYEIGYRPKNAKSSTYSKSSKFEIVSGQSVQIKF